MGKFKVTIRCEDEDIGEHTLAFVILANNEHTATLYGEAQAIAMNPVVHQYDRDGFQVYPEWLVTVEEIKKQAIP